MAAAATVAGGESSATPLSFGERCFRLFRTLFSVISASLSSSLKLESFPDAGMAAAATAAGGKFAATPLSFPERCFSFFRTLLRGSPLFQSILLLILIPSPVLEDDVDTLSGVTMSLSKVTDEEVSEEAASGNVSMDTCFGRRGLSLGVRTDDDIGWTLGRKNYEEEQMCCYADCAWDGGG